MVETAAHFSLYQMLLKQEFVGDYFQWRINILTHTSVYFAQWHHCTGNRFLVWIQQIEFISIHNMVKSIWTPLSGIRAEEASQCPHTFVHTVLSN